MNKSQLVQAVSNKAGFAERDVEQVINAFCSVVTDTLKRGADVTIVGFGKWEVRKRKGRNSFNPHTRKMVALPASVVPAFKAGKALKTAVNSRK